MENKYEDQATTFSFLKHDPEEIQFEVGRCYKDDRTGGKYFLCVKRTKFSASFFKENEWDDNLVDTDSVVTYMLDYGCWSSPAGYNVKYYEFIKSKYMTLSAMRYAEEDGVPVVQDFEFYTPEWQDGMG